MLRIVSAGKVLCKGKVNTLLRATTRRQTKRSDRTESFIDEDSADDAVEMTQVTLSAT